MAGKTFNNFKDLEKYIKDKVDGCLKQEVAQHVKEEIMSSVSQNVYDVYEPVVYERRAGNEYGGMNSPYNTGSLADPEKMKHSVNDGILQVTDDADFNHKFSQEHGGYGGVDLSKSLASNIEYGYGSKTETWNKARPFMKETVENMKQTKSHVMVLEDSLRKRGFKVEKG